MLETQLNAEACLARARALMMEQRAEEAIQTAREGLAFDWRADLLRLGLAEALLMTGDYKAGFREFEGRPSRLNCPARALPYPEWDGPLAGRSILVWGEQALGDEIQAARFIPRLRELGASRVTVACLPALVRTFEQLGADLVISRLQDVRVPKHDCWTSMWSLPYKLGLSPPDIQGTPYLTAAPDRRGGIGLVERGNPLNPRDAERSIPEGLLQVAFPQGQVLQPEGDVLDSLQRLAGLDLLITVDTSWAHMAGALGVPCWVLLPFRHLDWRWMRERRDSPWYNSLRLFRQPTPGNWSSVLAEVRQAHLNTANPDGGLTRIGDDMVQPRAAEQIAVG